jgi:hypothetical protein
MVSSEQLVDNVCKATLNEYNKTLEFTDKEIDAPTITVDPTIISDVVSNLVTFNEKQLRQLSLTNRRVRLFYFLKVHELIALAASLTSSNDDSQGLTTLLNELMNKVGDYETYKQFFRSDIQLEYLISCMPTVIFPDLIKIIFSYCDLSIYFPEDLNLILNKIITF